MRGVTPKCRALLPASELRCYDNADAAPHGLLTRTEAYDAVERFIDGFYNPTGRHSPLGYVSPLSYERVQGAVAA